jgi:myo-inositol-1(or 4)-monophosphatase
MSTVGVVRELSELLAVAEEAVDLARGIVLAAGTFEVHAKGDRDMVTDVDLRVEREVRALLTGRTPEIGVLGEEEGLSGDPTLRWALDPVDGTVNFVHGIPLNAVSLGLIDGDRSIVGVIDTPFLDRRYTAIDGGGAHADGAPISVSDTTALDRAIVSTGDFGVGPGRTTNPARARLTATLVEHVERIRMWGSAAIDLAWLAEGRTDAIVMLSNRPWDTAAGVVIAREAGAVLLDVDGTPHTSESRATIGVSPALVDALLPLIQDAVGG